MAPNATTQEKPRAVEVTGLRKHQQRTLAAFAKSRALRHGHPAQPARLPAALRVLARRGLRGCYPPCEAASSRRGSRSHGACPIVPEEHGAHPGAARPEPARGGSRSAAGQAGQAGRSRAKACPFHSCQVGLAPCPWGLA